jgi:hypothetical protein
VRELVAHHHHSRPTEITLAHIVAFIDALDNKRKLVECIFVALCRQEAKTEKAVKAVTWWLSHPPTLFNVFFHYNIVYYQEDIFN